MYTLTDGHTSAKASPSTPARTSVRHDITAAKDPRAGAAWIAGFTLGMLPDDAFWPGRAGGEVRAPPPRVAIARDEPVRDDPLRADERGAPGRVGADMPSLSRRAARVGR